MIRVILDEGVPNPLVAWMRAEATDVSSFPNAWKMLGDQALLKTIVQEGFDVLLTCDHNMPYQQHLTGLPVAVLVLPNLRLVEARNLAPRIVAILPDLPKSQFTILRSDGRAVAFDPSARKS